MDVSKEQILVVDDEEDLRSAIVEILTMDGFSPLIALDRRKKH
jgi:DNA-binding response OmpR family regulator